MPCPDVTSFTSCPALTTCFEPGPSFFNGVDDLQACVNECTARAGQVVFSYAFFNPSDYSCFCAQDCGAFGALTLNEPGVQAAAIQYYDSDVCTYGAQFDFLSIDSGRCRMESGGFAGGYDDVPTLTPSLSLSLHYPNLVSSLPPPFRHATGSVPGKRRILINMCKEN